MKSLLQSLFFAFIVVIAIATSHAQITANFTDGNGITSVDQYAGIAGNGWSGAWSIIVNSTGNYTANGNASVYSSTSLNGGGNYLSFNMAGTGSSGGVAAITRQHSSATVSLSSPLVYNFDYRVDGYDDDSNSSTAGIWGNFGVTIFSRPGASASTDSSQTWCITGNSNSSGWQFNNGNKAGSNTSVVSSNMSIAIGTVYHFTITVDPVNGNWQATVYDLSKNSGDLGYSYSTGTLGFRSNATSDGSFLEFGITDNNTSTTDSFTISIDNISIASIPEPGTISLLLLGSSGLAILGLRRRKS